MAVPRNRVSNSKKNLRRSHHAHTQKQMVVCSNCSFPKLPHVMCPKCYYYNGRAIIVKKADED